MKRSIFYLLILFLLGFSESTRGQSKWVTKSSTGFTPRAWLTSSTVKGKIYAIGGFDGHILSLVEAYDPLTDTWSTPDVHGKPSVLSNHTACVYNDLIYINGDPGLQIFDPEGGDWSKPKTTGYDPSANDLASCLLDGKIYVLGASAIYAFDPATNSWSNPSPGGSYSARNHASAQTLNGKIYLTGGEIGTTYFTQVDIYDPSTNTCIEGPPLPAARSQHGSCVLGGRLFVMGGVEKSGNTVDMFDPSTNTWTVIATIGNFTKRGGPGADTSGGRCYVMGGYYGAHLNTNEAFIPPSVSGVNTQAGSSLMIYPTVINRDVCLRNLNLRTSKITVTTVLGRTVLTLEHPNTSEVVLDLVPLTSGTYFVSIVSPTETIVRKIIKE